MDFTSFKIFVILCLVMIIYSYVIYPFLLEKIFFKKTNPQIKTHLQIKYFTNQTQKGLTKEINSFLKKPNITYVDLQYNMKLFSANNVVYHDESNLYSAILIYNG